MIGAASKYDFLFCQLKVAGKFLDDPLKAQLEDFLKGVKEDLYSDAGTIKNIISKKLPDIFALRLSALRWLKTEKCSNLVELLTKDVNPLFETMKRVKRLSMLAGHIVEALEWNSKVIGTIERKGAQITDLHSLSIPDVSFNQFIETIYFSNPDEGEVQMIIDWTKCSLYIEYITLAAFLIYDEKLLVSDNRIIELSGTLAEATQAYVSLAAGLNLISFEGTVKKGPTNAKGSAIFGKMLKDKNTIAQHLKNGGELSDLKDKFNFVNPLHFTTQ